MHIVRFVLDAGERIVADARDDPQQSLPRKTADNDKSPGEAIADYIHALGLKVEDLEVAFDGTTWTVRVSGVAEDQATKEQVILSCGNIAGVERVDENISVKQ